MIFIPVFLIVVFGIGYYYLLHDDNPEPIVDSEVRIFLEQKAKNYVLEQYNEEIGIAKIYYDHIYYGYKINVYAEENRALSFTLFSQDGTEITGDNLVESYWNYELKDLLSEAISDSFHCKYEINLGDHVTYSGEKPENFNSIPSYLDCWEEAGENEVKIYLDRNPSLDDGNIFVFLKAVKENPVFPKEMFRQFVLAYPDGTVINVDATQ